MSKLKFMRRNTKEYFRLGKRRKKLRKWRRPKGRDNKMRLKERGRPRTVEIGYKKSKKEAGEKVFAISNINQLKELKKGSRVLFNKVGKKKKIELNKLAKKLNLKILNFEKNLKKPQENEA